MHTKHKNTVFLRPKKFKFAYVLDIDVFYSVEDDNPWSEKKTLLIL